MGNERKRGLKTGLALLLGAAALRGGQDLDKPRSQISPADAMSLPAEGMFRRDSGGRAQQVRGGDWVGLKSINAGANVLDRQVGLKRLTSIEDRSAPESYRFSHFVGNVNYNKDKQRWEVRGCYSTAGGRSCNAMFEVPRGRISEIKRKIDNQ